ncbi:MAG: glycosyltransferase family 4 protein [Proteobacteria bacterium]|nr:glycosyltransferase family 4 protein [Pseudomonadota bacterium]
MKRIALVTSTYKNITSGVGTYANILVDALIDRGNEVFIISPDCEDKPPHFIKVNLPIFSFTPNKWVELSIRYSKILEKMRDTIHIVHFLDAREALFFKKKKDVFVIGTVHDTYSWDLQSQSILKKHFFDWKKRLIYYFMLHKLEKIAYKKFDLILSNTDFVRERLYHFYDLPEEKIKTVYLPAPLETISCKEREIKNNYKISFVGGNFQRKGLLQLIKAVDILRKEGINIKIVVAGRDKNQKIIEEWMRKEGYTGIVDFMGHLRREEVKKMIMDSDVFAMPSITEAYGLVYLEAMALGVPVIGTIEGGTKEIIIDGENGFLCNPDDVIDIAGKIKKCLDKSIRNKLIKNGFETVKRYSKIKFVEEMLMIYEDVNKI